jgi:GTPase
VTSLEAEPQDGSTEYKLHLLLRPRRSYNYSRIYGQTSGARILSGSITDDQAFPSITPNQSGTNLPRRTRLAQLTTQLLWRLQQSSSYHSSSFDPQHRSLSELQDDNPSSVVPGLEESKGALYEIGVADDGTFVGLAEDELDESLQTLNTMASSLGCTVSVLRKVAVGECQWVVNGRTKESLLWVAEAYVRPNMGNQSARAHTMQPSHEPGTEMLLLPLSDECGAEAAIESRPVTDQLRVTLTGATMSGKTSLLGTLTTDTLDNGRGKSRLNLLKHQHEIASGMTSSVTHELLGYSKAKDDHSDSQVVNFAHGDISSWVDIHSLCHDGRLIFFSDSAGHPRYRRTTVRGLIGWAPHWTLLCIPADNLEDTSGRFGSTPPPHETLGLSGADVDLSHEHLELCLKLNLPLVIVVTKRDLASRTGLRNLLAKVLTVLKRHGRHAFILPEYGNAYAESEMTRIASDDLADVAVHLAKLRKDPHAYVPIVLSSAVKGTGINSLHALLHELPIPKPSIAPMHDGSVSSIFDIEDTFWRKTNMSTVILSGAVRQGQITVGDELLVGPFMVDRPTTLTNGKRQAGGGGIRPLLAGFRSISGSSPDSTSVPIAQSGMEMEWYKVRVFSVRFLRLPVRAMHGDQVGTIAVTPADDETTTTTQALSRIRKGMILANGSPEARRTFVAEFARRDVDPLSIGSSVVVYFNSVRTSAKIIAGAMAPGRPDWQEDDNDDDDDDEGFAFRFDDDDDHGNGNQDSAVVQGRGEEQEEKLLVTFQFMVSREYVQVGSQVLVMPGGGTGLYGGGSRGEKGVAGLAGFVGRVVEG